MDTHKKTTQSAGTEAGTSVDAVIQFLTQRGILGDKKIDDEKVRAIKQQKAKNAYRHTNNSALGRWNLRRLLLKSKKQSLRSFSPV